MLNPPDDSSKKSSNPLSNLIQSIFSYDGNIMLAGVISLLLVILFVLLLHIYAKLFLARHRGRRSVSVLGPAARLHRFSTVTFDPTLSSSSSSSSSSSPTKGLEASAIASIPLFVYESNEQKLGLECVICLSLFEERDVGRKLPKCGHGFHVECIDMWLSSHSSCPICRAVPVVMVSTESKVAAEIADSTPENMVGDESENVGLSSMNEESALEIVVEEVPSFDVNENVVESSDDSLSTSSSSTSLSSQGSLKMILSTNRSGRKVHPSSNVKNESAE